MMLKSSDEVLDERNARVWKVNLERIAPNVDFCFYMGDASPYRSAFVSVFAETVPVIGGELRYYGYRIHLEIFDYSECGLWGMSGAFRDLKSFYMGMIPFGDLLDKLPDDAVIRFEGLSAHRVGLHEGEKITIKELKKRLDERKL